MHGEAERLSGWSSGCAYIRLRICSFACVVVCARSFACSTACLCVYGRSRARLLARTRLRLFAWARVCLCVCVFALFVRMIDCFPVRWFVRVCVCFCRACGCVQLHLLTHCTCTRLSTKNMRTEHMRTYAHVVGMCHCRAPLEEYARNAAGLRSYAWLEAVPTEYCWEGMHAHLYLLRARTPTLQ